MVNLLVTPDQAESLSLASNHTQIQLVLRNPLDTKTDNVAMTAMGNIFSGLAGPPKAVTAHIRRAAPRPTTQTMSVEVVNGTKRSEQKFVVPEAKE